MPVQATLLDEAFLTYRTFVSLLSSVSCHVTVERRTLSELVATHVTNMVTLSCMGVNMNLQTLKHITVINYLHLTLFERIVAIVENILVAG